MQTPTSDIEEIKAIDIKTVITSETNVTFKKNKGSYCPFCDSGNHNTKTSDSAFSVYPQKNTFKCFSCDAGSSVIDFIMFLKNYNLNEAILYLKERYFSGSIAYPQHQSIPFKPIVQKTQIMNFIPELDYKKTITIQDTHFHQYLKALFTFTTYTEDIQKQYNLGSWKDRKVIFWQMDEHGNVRTGKIMQYDPKTGKRVKDIKPNWMHNELGISDYETCFFGEHLIPGSDKPIGIVESEATACVASQYYKDITWIATGGKNNLRALLSRCDALKKNRKEIILYPDLSENGETYAEWLDIGADFRAQKYNISTSPLLEDSDATKEERKAGLDLRDYMVKCNIVDVLLHR